MALPIYTSSAFTGTTGVELAPNAQVEVRSEADDSLVTLYEDRDGNSQINNPFQADAFGRFAFFAIPNADGWRITVTSGADSHMLRYQQPMGSLAGAQASEFMMDFVAASDAGEALDDLGVSAFAQTLLDDADAATARGTLELPTVLTGTATGSGSLSAGDTASFLVTVTGAAFGDLAIASFTQAPTVTNLQMSAYVASADSVRVVITNHGSGTFDLSTRSVRAVVMKF